MSEDSLSTDGGLGSSVRDVERAGGSPPETPTGNGLDRLLPDLLDDVDEFGRAYLVRIRFPSDNPESTAKRLVDALGRQVDVLGDTSDAGFDPSSPVLDALVETDYESGAIARSLARLAPVEGVLVADVTDAAETALEDETDTEAADAAGANDVFQDLKEQVNQLGYGDVVDELEDVSFPGGPDPDEEIDLEAETGIDLGEDDAASPDPGGSGDTLDLDGDDTLDLDGDDTLDLDGGGDGGATDSDGELDIRGLLKNDGDEGGDDGTVREADENAISEAISEIELDPGPDEDEGKDQGEETTADDSSASTDAGDDALGDIPAPKQPSRRGSNRETGDASGASNERPTTEPGQETGSGGGANAQPTDQGTAATPESQRGPPESSSEPSDGSGSPSSVASGESGGSTRTAGPSATGDMDAFVANLVEALESGAVSSERRAELRNALDVGNTHSLDVRLEYLQKRVDNLAAYTDSWEAFLSEEGTGREFLDDVSEGLDELEQRVETIEAGGGAGGTGGADLTSVERRLSELEDTLESADERLAKVQRRQDEDVTRLDTRMDSVEAAAEQRLDAVEDALGSIKERVEALLEWREHVNDVLSRRNS